MTKLPILGWSYRGINAMKNDKELIRVTTTAYKNK